MVRGRCHPEFGCCESGCRRSASHLRKTKANRIDYHQLGEKQVRRLHTVRVKANESYKGSRAISISDRRTGCGPSIEQRTRGSRARSPARRGPQFPMEFTARRFEFANCRSVRREAETQFAMDAVIRKRLWSETGPAWKNDNGSKTVLATNTGWSLGHYSGDRSPDARSLRTWSASRSDGQSAYWKTEP